jgi:uncharacterized protein YeaO (DUF488 family)
MEADFFNANGKGTRMIKSKRVYDPSESGDGTRFLVERLWPRGMRKESLPMDAWLKDAAPSEDLRRWFGHDPAKWTEFRNRYFTELESQPDAIRPIVEAARQGNATLLYSAHDTEHNNAVALQEYVSQHLRPMA